MQIRNYIHITNNRTGSRLAKQSTATRRAIKMKMKRRKLRCGVNWYRAFNKKVYNKWGIK
jgi:hypothetical protein